MQPRSPHRVDPLTLVTGATGLVGSALTRLLVDDGQRVRILRRESSSVDLLGPAALRVEHCFGDVTEPEGLAEAFRGVTHVYHVAGTLGDGRPVKRDVLDRVNVGGTRHVVDAALRAGVRRLVHTSSIAALGRPETPGPAPIDEGAEWVRSRMNSPYAVSKHLAELEVQRGVAEGLDAVLVNPSLVFGPGRPGENTTQIAERVRDGALPGVPAGGTNVVDVDDVALGHLRAMERGRTGERYVLAGENLTWAEILGALAEAFGVAPPRRPVSPRAALALGTAAEVAARLTGRAPLLTRERARTMSAFYRYSHRKAADELGCTFRPFTATAARIAEALGAPAARVAAPAF